MKITQFALALVERHSEQLGMEPELVEDIADTYAKEVGETTAMVASLFEKRAGFATDVNGLSDENRLGDPRLRTTYPDERRRALTKRMLCYGDELGDLLPRVLALALKRELAQDELAEERRRDRDYADAQQAREALGLYVEVIDTIDTLYNDYGVTRRHYPCLSDEDLRDIAAILLRQPADTLPVKRRRGHREGRHA